MRRGVVVALPILLAALAPAFGQATPTSSPGRSRADSAARMGLLMYVLDDERLAPLPGDKLAATNG